MINGDGEYDEGAAPARKPSMEPLIVINGDGQPGVVGLGIPATFNGAVDRDQRRPATQ